MVWDEALPKPRAKREELRRVLRDVAERAEFEPMHFTVAGPDGRRLEIDGTLQSFQENVVGGEAYLDLTFFGSCKHKLR